MLSEDRIEAVKALLKQGLSFRRVTELTRVSRAKVAAIAHKNRPDYEAIRREKAVEQAGHIERCPTCGARVTMPCRACRVRAGKSLA